MAHQERVASMPSLSSRAMTSNDYEAHPAQARRRCGTLLNPCWDHVVQALGNTFGVSCRLAKHGGGRGRVAVLRILAMKLFFGVLRYVD